MNAAEKQILANQNIILVALHAIYPEIPGDDLSKTIKSALFDSSQDTKKLLDMAAEAE
jgi:hypothetical protein